MNTGWRGWMRRGLGVLVVAAFVAGAAGTSRTQDDEYLDLVAGSHGNDLIPGGKPIYLSRIAAKKDDPNTPGIDESQFDEFKGAMEFEAGTFFLDLAAYPTNYNPQCVLGAQGISVMNSRVWRFRTDMTNWENNVPTLGAVKGAKLVTGTPLRDHYFVTLGVNDGMSSAGLAFVDVNAQVLLEQFRNGVNFHDLARGAEYDYFDNGTPSDLTDDRHRWYVLDIDRIGWTDESLYVLELTDAQTRSATPDPFGNPDPPHGPPFPQIPTMLDQAPPTVWRKLYGQQNGFTRGNDDRNMDLARWVGHTGSREAHFIIGANTELVPGNPPTWRTLLWGFDAWVPPANFPTPTNVDNTEGSAPTFHQMKVVGNYVFLSTGIHLIWPGGTRIRSYRLQAGPSQVNPPPPFPWTPPYQAGWACSLQFQQADTWQLPGLDGAIDGMVASYDQRHLYVGTDQSNNIVYRLDAHDLTVDDNVGSPTFGMGFMKANGSTHFQRLPPPQQTQILYNAISMTTKEEDEMEPPLIPPNRVWPLLAGVSFRIITDLIGSFDGNTGTSPGEALGCSAGGAAAAAGLLAGIALFAGLASAVRRR